MALAEGPDLDDEVSRSSSHLVKDDGAGATDPKTYQLSASRPQEGAYPAPGMEYAYHDGTGAVGVMAGQGYGYPPPQG
eukprot:CAMPEP_0172155932 /NCGR_PEP_ID=MMETSP1050-20130122/2908_1 /TAXON_ID=233186 /ORGANISM="Cryptomonas curvata, Strain CCAP979/52" /LENGTH=77 /DNA_ID=CAMNT_0012824901 /DNA_START=240 /DNA_END=469 /DNA_ORIENTATION=-